MWMLLACASPMRESADPPMPDSGEPVVDSAPPVEDSSPPEDTAPPEDSAPPEDTGPPDDTGPDTWRSALYAEDWTPAYTHSSGHCLHDFSFAGYHAGEAPLPTPPGPSFDVTAYGAVPTGASDSSTAAPAVIAAASAAASALVDFARNGRCIPLNPSSSRVRRPDLGRARSHIPSPRLLVLTPSSEYLRRTRCVQPLHTCRRSYRCEA